MNLPRIFANAFARRIAYVVVALVLAWMGMGQARAGTYGCSDSVTCDEGQAYSACMTHAATIFAGSPGIKPYCQRASDQFLACAHTSANPSCQYSDNNAASKYGFRVSSTCATRLNEFSWCMSTTCGSQGGGLVCSQGCSYIVTLEGGDLSSYYSPTGDVCSSTDEPILDTDRDGVPDDEDAFPNDPNESKDTDGDGIGDNADVAPEDPDNGKDDGEGDEKDNQASGGGDCKAPPTCKGDGIACNTNFQIWKLRCEKSGSVTGDPTNCTGSYTCVGDSVQCAQVALMRKNACTGATTGTPGTGTEDGPYAGTGGAFPSAGEGDDPEPGDSVKTVNIGIGMLDTEGSLGGGSCPDFGSFNVMGRTIQVDPNGWWCQIIEIARMCLIVLGAFIALRVLMDR